MFRKLAASNQLTKAISVPQSRSFFNKFFGRATSGKCRHSEPIFRKFQAACEDNITALESTFNEHSSLNHLLTTVYKCQTVGIRDKFFYDALFEKVQTALPRIVQAKDMILLGVALGTNPDYQKDHPDLIKAFYAHCFKHRYVLSINDKKTLAQIF